MTEPADEDDQEARLNAAGCLVLAISLAVIALVAIPVVQWRDPVTGKPLGRTATIVAPIVAGALCNGIGTLILRLLGVPIIARPKKSSDESSDDNLPFAN